MEILEKIQARPLRYCWLGLNLNKEARGRWDANTRKRIFTLAFIRLRQTHYCVLLVFGRMRPSVTTHDVCCLGRVLAAEIRAAGMSSKLLFQTTLLNTHSAALLLACL